MKARLLFGDSVHSLKTIEFSHFLTLTFIATVKFGGNLLPQMTESIYVENFPSDWLYCVAIFFPHEYVSIWPSPKSSFMHHFSSGKDILLSRAQAASGVFLLYAKHCSHLSHSIFKN